MNDGHVDKAGALPRKDNCTTRILLRNNDPSTAATVDLRAVAAPELQIDIADADVQARATDVLKLLAPPLVVANFSSQKNARGVSVFFPTNQPQLDGVNNGVQNYDPVDNPRAPTLQIRDSLLSRVSRAGPSCSRSFVCRTNAVKTVPVSPGK
jgi:hypothetical protein